MVLFIAEIYIIFRYELIRQMNSVPYSLHISAVTTEVSRGGEGGGADLPLNNFQDFIGLIDT